MACSFSRHDPLVISISGVCRVQDRPTHTLEELKRNIRNKINNINKENYSELQEIL